MGIGFPREKGLVSSGFGSEVLEDSRGLRVAVRGWLVAYRGRYTDGVVLRLDSAMGGAYGAFLRLLYRSREVTSVTEFGRLFGVKVGGAKLRPYKVKALGGESRVGCRVFGGLVTRPKGVGEGEGCIGCWDGWVYYEVLLRLECRCDLSRERVRETFTMAGGSVEFVGSWRLMDGEWSGRKFSEQRLFKDVEETESWISRLREVFGGSVFDDDERCGRFCGAEYGLRLARLLEDIIDVDMLCT